MEISTLSLVAVLVICYYYFVCLYQIFICRHVYKISGLFLLLKNGHRTINDREYCLFAVLFLLLLFLYFCEYEYSHLSAYVAKNIENMFKTTPRLYSWLLP